MNAKSNIEELQLIEALKSLPSNQYTFRRIFLLLTRMFYSDPQNYLHLNKKFKNFVWSKDKIKSTLEIEDDFNFDSASLDNVPSIYVGCGAINYATKVIDNQTGSNADRSGSQHAKTATCPIKLAHISKSPDEVQQLGDLSAQYYLGLQTMFQTRVHFRSYEVATLTEVRIQDLSKSKTDRQFIVDLIINIGFNASWVTLTESSRIKTITFGQTLRDFEREPTE